jgi:hypothetical protein
MFKVMPTFRKISAKCMPLTGCGNKNELLYLISEVVFSVILMLLCPEKLVERAGGRCL